MKTIILSNSPKCLLHEAGKLIDSFDVVVRLNNFVLEGYEKFIGSKTTVWMHNNNFNINNIDTTDIEKIIVMSIRPTVIQTDESKTIQEKEICKFISEYLKSLTPGYNDHSLGLHAIYYYIRNNEEVFSYGFDTPFEVDGHYWNIPNHHWDGHKKDQEKIVMDHFIKSNYLHKLEDILNK